MSHLSKVVRAGVGRRRVQSLVMMLTTMTAVTASLLGGGLLVSAHVSFDQGFARQRGAHLTVRFDPAQVNTAQLAQTARVPGVTASAGPYPIASLNSVIGENNSGLRVGLVNPALDFVGRTGPGGAVDDLTVTAGHWATGPGQVVLSDFNSPLGVGDKLRFPALPGKPILTVVGLARSAGHSADAWVSPQQLAALTPPAGTTGYQMLYRFARAGDNARLNVDRTALAAAVPPRSMTSAASYLKIKTASDKSTATFVPFVIAFAVIGLVMSVLIIGIVVSGAVGASTRRIGVLKAIGYSPAQVVRAYVGQALVPAGVGTALGVLLGNLAAVPVLAKAGEAFNTGAGRLIAPWLDLAVALGALTAVAGTALVPALRAGRLRTVEALTVGRTPSPGRGWTARRLLGRLPMPRSVSLGLGNSFARPGRSATMVTAVVLGSVGVSFGVGLVVSLNTITDGMNRDRPGAVQVMPLPPFGPAATTHQLQVAELPAIAAKIAAYPGTRRYFSTDRATFSVVGLAGPTTVIRYDGDAAWGAYQMVAGRWFHHPGEAVVPSAFLQATGTKVGDSITLSNGSGRSAPVRIVGEAFDMQESGMTIRTDSASLAALNTPVDPQSVDYQIDLKPGSSRQEALDRLQLALKPYGFCPGSYHPLFNPTILSMDTLAVMLTGMLVAVAGLGVLNTVVLDTRERVHDLGVFKALGMSPKQTVAMVLTSVSGIGLLGGLIGTPLGVALHHAVLPAMGRAAGTRLPAADLDAYHPGALVPLVLGGLVIAIAGALLPAAWAARTGTATALRTE
ncbi:ABC transporter permease [Actinacidiphila bryophytorum]|uniref:ABC transporter permease n=1 Tax=Actinacidiphila bryophytorum TaxID=1436133 RepID=A0A9W4H4J3_9ACTN|nr:FtsX-like permease family protein [Actinacidiphila bryophytorum]MBM9435755.1 FtsX-like permease family protein [Actinacidiphila bryophytorum]MBN6541599.1 FtsX-like permease family protein [Actinacidiphila bryophytorum]CAG7650389.1 ABC transporter permease [Actinacidiphila bryophytorum]